VCPVCLHIRSLGLGISTQVLFAMHASIGMETYAVLFFGTLFSCQGAHSSRRHGSNRLRPSGHRSDRAVPQGAVVTPVLTHSAASSAATCYRASRQRTGDFSRSVRIVKEWKTERSGVFLSEPPLRPAYSWEDSRPRPGLHRGRSPPGEAGVALQSST
jgi:hypothetical protein